MLNNKQRRELLTRANEAEFPGSILDVFRGAEQGRDLINEFKMSQGDQMAVASTPEEQNRGLRPFHNAGRTDMSMTFTDVPPNTPFNTVGMKKPIDIKTYDRQGHLVKSYDAVPPGMTGLSSGPNSAYAVERPVKAQSSLSPIGNLTQTVSADKTRVPMRDPNKDPLYLRGHSFNTDDPESRRILKNIHDSGIHIQTPEGTKSSYTVPAEQYDFLIRKLDELGNPDIREMSKGDLEHTLFGGRAHTNADDKITISTDGFDHGTPLGGARGAVHQILAEIPHIQLAQGDGDIQGISTLTNAVRTVKDIVDAGGNQGITYRTPGTIEHTAHSVLEPELREEYKRAGGRNVLTMGLPQRRRGGFKQKAQSALSPINVAPTTYSVGRTGGPNIQFYEEGSNVSTSEEGTSTLRGEGASNRPRSSRMYRTTLTGALVPRKRKFKHQGQSSISPINYLLDTLNKPDPVGYATQQTMQANDALRAETERVADVRANVLTQAQNIEQGQDNLTDEAIEAYRFHQDTSRDIRWETSQAVRAELRRRQEMLPDSVKNVLPDEGRYNVFNVAPEMYGTDRQLYCTPYGYLPYQKAGASDLPIVHSNPKFRAGARSGSLPFQSISASERQPGDVALQVGMAPANYGQPGNYVLRPHHTTIYSGEAEGTTDLNDPESIMAYNAQGGIAMGFGESKIRREDAPLEFYRYVGQTPQMQQTLDARQMVSRAMPLPTVEPLGVRPIPTSRPAQQLQTRTTSPEALAAARRRRRPRFRRV